MERLRERVGYPFFSSFVFGADTNIALSTHLVIIYRVLSHFINSKMSSTNFAKKIEFFYDDIDKKKQLIVI